MANASPESSDSRPLYFPSGLSERVRGRVAQARRAIDQKVAKRNSFLRPTLSVMPDEGPGPHPDEQREARSILKVFRELRDIYRQHRATTGQEADPGLRDAVTEFKKLPSLQSLTSVAVFLEDRKLLEW